MSESVRLAELEKKFQNFEVTLTRKLKAVSNAPRDNRKLTGVVLANLGSEKAAQEFVKKYKGTPLTVSGCSLIIHHARTELNTKRNTVLRKATEAVKARMLELDKNSQAKIEIK